MAGIEASSGRTLDAAAQPKGRELRLALGMRGGVSLAVWIGGACAEIAAMRESRAGDAGGFWGPLLDAAGYGAVRIDVLAGASAGGLNGVLLAASLLYRVPFGSYRDIWLEVADISSLLRDPARREAISVLRGDEYFLAEMGDRLRRLVSAVPAERELAVDYLDLHLSATLVAPTAVPLLEDWGERYEEVSHRASFRFRHNRFTSDFRHGGDPGAENAGAVTKLALAARSTSSFPGAFEPATVRVRRPERVGARAALTDRANLFGMFSDASRPVQRVIDGGVLDNIPLAKAIAAVAASSAEGPTERWLLYLHPSPDDVPAADGETPELHTIRTVLGASSARGTAESVIDDLDVLRAHNAFADRYRTMRRALLGMLAGRDAARFLGAAKERSADYWRLRAEGAARRVRGLLEDPVAVLREDPFTSEAERWPLSGDEAWSLGARQHLEGVLRDRELGGGRAVPTSESELAALGVSPLPRAAHVCLESVWRLERLGGDPTALAEEKQRLYAVADTAALLAHMGDLFWPVYAVEQRPDPARAADWAATALAAQERFLSDPDAAQAGAAGVHEAFDTLREELRRRRALLPAGGPSPLPETLWAHLVACVVRLGEVAAAVPGRPEDDEAGLFLEMLRYVAGDADRAAQVLTAVEMLTFPLHALSPTPPQSIRYLRVAGSRRSPLERFFPGGALTVRDKLAGNDLMNFAAFYKRSWRANDWMWGRLDAAATLVDLVVQPAAVRAHFTTAGVPADADPERRAHAFAELLRAQLCRPLETLPAGAADADRDAWAGYFAGVWADRAEEVQAEALALFAGEGGSALTCARELLTLRRQWELLVQEVPAVVRATADEALADGRGPNAGRIRERVRDALQREPLLRSLVADDAATQAPVRTPEQLQRFLGSYTVGRETVASEVGRPRFTALVANLLVVVWNALTYGAGRVAGPLRPVGGLLRLVRLLALATVSAPRWALVTLPVLAVVGAAAALSPPGQLGRVPGAVLAIAALSTLLYWSRPLRAVAGIALLAAGAWAALRIDASVSVAVGQGAPWVTEADGVRVLIILAVVTAVAWVPWLVRTLGRAARAVVGRR